MNGHFDPHTRTYSLLGYNVTNLLHELQDEHTLKLPPLEKVLSQKGKTITNAILQNAQERQKRWQKNIARVQKKLDRFEQTQVEWREKKEPIKKDVLERQIALMQKKYQRESKLITERLAKRHAAEEARENERALKRQEAREQKEEAYFEKRAERKEMMKPKLPTPNEKGAEFRKEKEVQVERAQAKSAEKRQAFLDKILMRQEERRKKIDEFLEVLKEKVIIKEERRKRQAERTAYIRSLIIAPFEYRKKRRAVFKQREAMAEEYREAKTELMLKHFERMKQRMIDIMESSHIHGEEAREAINEIVSHARKKNEDILLASGNPLQLRKVLDDLDYFSLVRERMNDIVETTEAHGDESREHIKELIRRARIRRDHNMYLSGNPLEVFKRLTELEYFIALRNREAFKIIEHGKESRAYRRILSGLPAEDRKQIQKLFHRILFMLLNHPISGAHNINPLESTILAVIRKDPVFLTKLLVERLKAVHHSCQFLYLLEEKEHYTYKLHNKSEQSLDEIKLVLNQENFKAILSGMLIDKEMQADALLRKTTTPGETKINAEEKQQKISKSYFDTLIHSLQRNSLVPTGDANAHENQTPDEIYTIIEVPNTFFDFIQQEIDRGLRKDIFTEEDMLKTPSPEEKIEATHKKNEERHKHLEENTHTEKIHERWKEFIKLIEEQNMTAQDKLYNEQKLLDFFF